jgi:Fuc2NAc and GlcNAc transferase
VSEGASTVYNLSIPVRVAIASAVCVLTWAATALARRGLVATGIVDVPNARSSHREATPRGAGLAIVAATTLVAGCLLASTHVPGGRDLGVLLACGLVAAAIGLVDDARGLPAGLRLAADVLLALILLAVVDAPARATTALGWGPNGMILVGLGAILWIVGLRNAYNFMDGIDGIAGIQGIVAGIGWSVIAPPTSATAWLGLILASACLGFLPFNWQPAKVFMGDVGSCYLGFIFAGMTTIAACSDWRFAGAGAILLWPFLFDTGTTLVRRIATRENILQAHRGHIYQRLVRAGYSHATVSTLYAALDVSCVFLAMRWMNGSYLLGFAGLFVIAAVLQLAVRHSGASRV